MRNRYDDEDDHDYSPNELARLSSSDPELHDKVIKSNLEEGDTVARWEQRNMDRARKILSGQRVFRDWE